MRFLLVGVAAFAVLAALLAPGDSVAAQGGLDFTRNPNYGSVNLAPGFQPDPHTVQVTSGGSVSISSVLTGNECRGFATAAPDYRVSLAGSTSLLRLFFVSQGDTTLVVNDAAGNWYCDDDSFGTLHPTIDLVNAAPGQIDIWVGSFSSGSFVSGTLYVTEFNTVTPAAPTATGGGLGSGGQGQGGGLMQPTPTPVLGSGMGNVPAGGNPGTATGMGLSFSATPNYGSVNLMAGFTPDPHTVQVTSGGGVNVASNITGTECRGFVTEAPDYRINWSGTTSLLRLFFVSQGDTTLVINDAMGNWYCDDDSFGTLNPTIDLVNPAPGQIDIWVGSFSSSAFVNGTLYVTEYAAVTPAAPTGQGGGLMQPTPTPVLGSGMGNVPAGGNPGTATGTGLSFSGTPNYGSVNLMTGFTPDPHTVQVTSGGAVNVASNITGTECRGFVTGSPDYRVNWSGTTSLLRFFFVSQGDTTLVVNDAAGNWYCDDDSFGTLNPTIDLVNPAPGQIDIWVGSFSSSTFVNGTLYVTEYAAVTPAAPTGQGGGLGSGGQGQGGGLTQPTPTPMTGGGQSSASGLNFTASPNYGFVNLTAGFMPDPHTRAVTSGGNVSVSANLTGNECRGFVTSAPDYRVNWSGTTSLLRLFFVGQGDTTLVVNDAAGNWYCDDDSFGTLHPAIDLTNPTPGQIDIWVGSFSSGSFVSGTLYVTEMSAVDPADY
jgi:hypothetical protein